MVTHTQTTQGDNEIGGMEKVNCAPRIRTKRSKAVFEEAVKERDTYKVDLRKVSHKRQGKRDIELSGLELDKPDKWVDRERCEGGLAECTQSEGRGRWDCDWHCKTVTGSGRSTD